MVTARGQRLDHASAKQRGITFPDGTGRAGQYRGGLLAAADTVLAGGSAPWVVMSNRGHVRAWRGRYWDVGHVTGPPGDLADARADRLRGIRRRCVRGGLLRFSRDRRRRRGRAQPGYRR
jgi:hypothetical protein